MKNAWSVDGLPGMKVGLQTGKAENIKPLAKMKGPRIPAAYQNPHTGFSLQHLVLVAIFSALFSTLFVMYGWQVSMAVDSGLLENVKRAIVSPLATMH